MKPDTPTILLLGTALCGVFALLQISIADRTQYSALRIWAAANISFSLGCAAMAAVPLLSVPLGALLVQELFLLGAALSVRGLDALNGRDQSAAEPAAILGSTTLALGLSLAGGDHYGERTLILALGLAWYGARAARLLTRLPQHHAHGIGRVCALLLLMFVALYLGRGVALAGGWMSSADVALGPVSGFTRLFGVTTALVWGFCSIFLAFDRAASVDPLTGLLNRRLLASCADRATRDALASGQPLSVLMIDIDSFKAINDGFGHQAGDAVLHAFRTEVQKAVRAGHDLVGRFGGDEFCVVLPGTNAAQAGVIAERLRRHCEANLGQGLTRPFPVTISIGIASLAPDRASLVELTADADAALYAAKAGGRNRVVYAGPDGPPCARSSPR